MKIDPYYQRLKCRSMTLVSGNIRFLPIVPGLRLRVRVRVRVRGTFNKCFIANFLKSASVSV